LVCNGYCCDTAADFRRVDIDTYQAIQPEIVMHLYAFGSVCRGDVTHDSDIDLLALVSGHDARLNPAKYSIYSYAKMKTMWLKGSPFAWHLSLESRLLYADDGSDYLGSLGQPAPYSYCLADCQKFYGVFQEALASLQESLSTKVFDLSSSFLSIRNISTCFALGVLGKTLFSRHAALQLPTGFQLPISHDSYRIMERARILCTRSTGVDITDSEARLVLSESELINRWMITLVEKAERHG
jgi:hypothetical protein